MGVVWRAVQLATGRAVALKLMAAARLGSEHARTRFTREVELTSRLEHPNIARVYDSGLRQGTFYYAMELIDGLPLDQYAQRNRPDRRTVLKLVREVCLAVQHAHQYGVVHRDLKPSNILVTADGRPHVVDFGLAKEIASTNTDVTHDGQWAGTPMFMSPEQAAGDLRKIDTRTDVYALGAVLYLLLEGRLPHDGDGTHYQVLRRVMETEVRYPTAVDGELAAVLLKALAQDPDDRYASASDLARDLDGYLGGNPLMARPRTGRYVLWRWIARHKIRVSLTAGLLVATLSATWAALARINREHDEAVIQRADAVAQRVEADTQRAQAVARRQQAEIRLADSLVAQGDSLGASHRWIDAAARYNEAREIMERLGRRPQACDIALAAVYAEAPPPLGRLAWPEGVSAAGPVVARAAAFSPDGRRFLRGGPGGDLVLWDVVSGRVVRLFGGSGHRGLINEVAFAPDGRHVASCGVDGTARVWDIDSGREVIKLSHPLNVMHVQFSPDGRTVWTCTQDKARAWDSQTGQLLHEWGALAGYPGLAVSPDGQWILSVLDGCVHARRADGSEWRQVAVPDGSIMAFALSRDGGTVACGYNNGTIVLADIRRPGSPLRTLRGHTGVITNLMFFEGDNSLVSCAADSTLRIWDVPGARTTRAYAVPVAGGAAVPSPDGRLFVTWARATDRAAADGGVDVWGTADAVNAEAPILRGHDGSVGALAASPDGQLLASGCADGTVRVWDVATRRPIHVLAGHAGPVGAVAFSPDGQTLASGGRGDGVVRLWDLETGREARRCVIGNKVQAIAFAAGASPLLFVETEQFVIAWNPANGTLWKLHSSETLARGVGQLGRSNGIAAVNVKGSAVEWRLPIPFPVRTSPVCPQFHAAVFSPDGLAILAADTTPTPFLWDIAGGRRLRDFSGHVAQVMSVALSLDGRQALSGSADATARLWDCETGRQLRAFTLNGETVSTVSFFPTGTAIAAADDNGAIRVWDFGRPARHREWDARIAQARHALEKNPEDGPALASLGEWYAFRGLSGWAVDLLVQARARGGDVSSLTLAVCYWQMDKIDAACVELKAALERKETSPAYLAILIAAVQQASPSTRP